MKEPVYVDSNIFLFPVIYEGIPKAKRAEEVLRKIATGELEAYTSTLTWDEVVWVVYKVMGYADSVEIGRKLLAFPNLRLISVSSEVIIEAQRLMEGYRLSPRDSTHCASALLRGVKLSISEDKDFDVVKELVRLSLKDFIEKL